MVDGRFVDEIQKSGFTCQIEIQQATCAALLLIELQFKSSLGRCLVLPTRLLLCATLLFTLGILTPIYADPSLKAGSVAAGLLQENPGRHLALGHYKQNSSLVLPERSNGRALSVASGLGAGEFHIHGYRDSESNQKIANPEPATMVLLGSGLIGIAAAIRKRRNSRGQE